MPKGKREAFKVTYFPDLRQRRVLDVLEAEASRAHVSAERELVREYNLLRMFKSREELFVESLSWEDRHVLSDFGLRSVVNRAYDTFLERIKAAAGGPVELAVRHKVQPDVDVPMEEVIFSASEHSVRLPHVGIVRFSPNKNINTSYGPAKIRPSTEDPRIRTKVLPITENKARLNSRVRRMALNRLSSTYYLVMDCTDPEDKPVLKKRRAKGLPSILR